MTVPTKISLDLSDKPNLKHLLETNTPMFKEILSTMMKVAEEAASHQRAIPWYSLPNQLNENLNFANTVPALMEAFFSVEQLHPEYFGVLGLDIHPLAFLKKKKIGEAGGYSKWRQHFDMPERSVVTPEVITDILRKMLYYTKYIDMEALGKAVLSNQLEAHKAIPMLNAERLPFTPALRYQKESFGDLKVGKFWEDIGAFYGGEYEERPEECPACHYQELEDLRDYVVCHMCNLGVKVVAAE